MAAQFPADNPYLSKGFEPIRIECDSADLIVSGEIPRELSGTYYRIGPNPQYAPRGVYNPLLGDGMIHAFRIAGQRVAYRNRWIRTQQFALERAAGRALFATSGNRAEHDPEVAGLSTDGVANTHIVWHGGRLLALEEGHAPIEKGRSRCWCTTSPSRGTSWSSSCVLFRCPGSAPGRGSRSSLGNPRSALISESSRDARRPKRSVGSRATPA